MLAPISSIKHYVQFTEFNVASATVSTKVLVNAVAAPANPEDCKEGSVVKAVFIELWLLADTNAVSSFVCTVDKAVGTQAVPSFTNMTTLNSYNNKKNILFTSQGLLGENGSTNPTPVLRQWIKIPKGKQRQGLSDEIRLNIAAIGATQITGCSFATYKEYN